MGYLTRYATAATFAEGIEAPAYIAENFPNVTTAEVDGILYTLYSK